MGKKLLRKLGRLMERFESDTMTAEDKRALKVLLRGHARLDEAVKTGDMKNAMLLVGEMFDGVPSH